MALEASFKRLFDAAGGSEAFEKFLITQKIFEIGSYGVLAAIESDVKAEIMDPATTAGVSFELLGDKVAPKKLWALCRKHMALHKPASPLEADEPLPEETEKDIKHHWQSSHGFVLPDAWLLVATLQGKLWRGVCQNPPRIEVLMVESLRTLANSEKPFGTQMAVVPGKAVEASAVIADAAVSQLDVYVRCRAWLMTLAYVTIRNKSYFDLQTAIFASEKILALVSQTFDDGHVAPTSFYVSAWASTVHYFSEQARVTSGPLKSIVMNTGAWEHKWTCWQPNKNGGGATRGVPDLPPAIANELEKLRTPVKMWQGKADSFRIEADKLRNGVGKGGKQHGKGGSDSSKREREYDNRGGRDRSQRMRYDRDRR